MNFRIDLAAFFSAFFLFFARFFFFLLLLLDAPTLLAGVAPSTSFFLPTPMGDGWRSAGLFRRLLEDCCQIFAVESGSALPWPKRRIDGRGAGPPPAVMEGSFKPPPPRKMFAFGGAKAPKLAARGRLNDDGALVTGGLAPVEPNFRSSSFLYFSSSRFCGLRAALACEISLRIAIPPLL